MNKRSLMVFAAIAALVGLLTVFLLMRGSAREDEVIAGQGELSELSDNIEWELFEIMNSIALDLQHHMDQHMMYSNFASLEEEAQVMHEFMETYAEPMLLQWIKDPDNYVFDADGEVFSGGIWQHSIETSLDIPGTWSREWFFPFALQSTVETGRYHFSIFVAR